MSIIDLYYKLYHRRGTSNGSDIDMSEQGRQGGVSTGQPFKFVSNIDIDPTDPAQANPSIVLGYTGSDLTTITKTINGVQYQQTLTYDSGNLVGISAWVEL